MLEFTVIEADKKSDKDPIPVREDLRFRIKNLSCKSLSAALDILQGNFVLAKTCFLPDGYAIVRRKLEDIKKYQKDKTDWFMINFDNVQTIEAQFSIFQYFKNYDCIFTPSRKYNDVNDFSMKGILRCKPATPNEIKKALLKIYTDLEEFGKIETNMAGPLGLCAPINRKKILWYPNNPKGTQGHPNKEKVQLYDCSKNQGTRAYKNVSPVEYRDPNVDFTGMTAPEVALRIFASLGFQPYFRSDSGYYKFHSNAAPNDSGYFWYRENPFTLFAVNSPDAISINKIIKDIPTAKHLLNTDINYYSLLSSGNTGFSNMESVQTIDDIYDIPEAPQDRDIFKEIFSVPEPKVEEYSEYCVDAAYSEVININERYIKISEPIVETITEFLDSYNAVLSIRSPMGTGKSTLIKRIIKDAKDKDLKVLVITNRVTVARDFKDKFKLHLYSDGTYKPGDNLICQLDSLHKYDMSRFDVIIIDEFLSVVLHSKEGIFDKVTNITKLYSALNKKVVIADAFLTGYECKFFSSEQKKIIINNNYRDDIDVQQFSSEKTLQNELIRDAIAVAKHPTKTITVSCTSREKILKLTTALRKLNIKVQDFHSDTPALVKDFIMRQMQIPMKQVANNVANNVINSWEHSGEQVANNVINSWEHSGEQVINSGEHSGEQVSELFNKPWDVLIYSPTLTVGVSNLNDVDVHYHLDCAKSCNVISSMQMIKRSRRATKIKFWINSVRNYFSTDYQSVAEEYMNGINKSILAQAVVEYTDGDCRISKIGSAIIRSDVYYNILRNHQIKSAEFLLRYQFKNGAQQVDTQDKFNNLNDILKKNVTVIHNDEPNVQELFKTMLTKKELDLLISNTKFNIPFYQDLSTDLLKEALVEFKANNNFFRRIRYYRLMVDFIAKRISINELRAMLLIAVKYDNKTDEKFLLNLIGIEDVPLMATLFDVEYNNEMLDLNDNAIEVNLRVFSGCTKALEVIKMCELEHSDNKVNEVTVRERDLFFIDEFKRLGFNYKTNL